MSRKDFIAGYMAAQRDMRMATCKTAQEYGEWREEYDGSLWRSTDLPTLGRILCHAEGDIWSVIAVDPNMEVDYGFCDSIEEAKAKCDAVLRSLIEEDEDIGWYDARRKRAQDIPAGWEFNECDGVWEKLYDGDLYGEVIDGYGFTLYESDGVDGDVLCSGGSPVAAEAMAECDRQLDIWLGNGGSWIGGKRVKRHARKTHTKRRMSS